METIERREIEKADVFKMKHPSVASTPLLCSDASDSNPWEVSSMFILCRACEKSA